MRALLLVCFVTVVVCGRLCIVFYAGSPIPFHDQWTAEAHGIWIPYFHHGLIFRSLFVTHGDHVIALTRAIDFGLGLWEGKWDCISQMVVNCVLSPFGLFPLMLWAVRQSGPRLASVLCLVVGTVYGSPLFYGNIVWGFQSQILLMVALSVAHLYLILENPGGWVRWGFAMGCGLLAAISFGSGFLAVVASSLALLSNGQRYRSHAYVFATVGGCVAIVVLSLWLAPSHPTMKDFQLATMLRAGMHGLSFPARLFSYWGLCFWLPVAAALALAANERVLFARWIFPLAAAGWCVGQILVISLGRSAMAPRYYDILMVGTVANGLLAIELLRYPWRRRRIRNGVLAAFGLWLVAIGYKTAESTDEHLRGDLPVLAEQARQQITLVANYYAGERNPAILRNASFPIRPFPDVDFLDDTLRRPEIVSLWPSYIFSWRATDNLMQLPWIGDQITRDRWLRSALWFGVVAWVILYIQVWRTLLEKRPGRDELQPG